MTNATRARTESFLKKHNIVTSAKPSVLHGRDFIQLEPTNGPKSPSIVTAHYDKGKESAIDLLPKTGLLLESPHWDIRGYSVIEPGQSCVVYADDRSLLSEYNTGYAQQIPSDLIDRQEEFNDISLESSLEVRATTRYAIIAGMSKMTMLSLLRRAYERQPLTLVRQLSKAMQATGIEIGDATEFVVALDMAAGMALETHPLVAEVYDGACTPGELRSTIGSDAAVATYEVFERLAQGRDPLDVLVKLGLADIGSDYRFNPS